MLDNFIALVSYIWQELEGWKGSSRVVRAWDSDKHILFWNYAYRICWLC
jgi:hypothetical protein